MSARYEFKFLISHAEYELLRTNIAVFLAKDKYCLERKYPVLSLYFDTYDYEYYYQKVNGENRHFKMRARTYEQSFSSNSDIWLEQKIKIGDRQGKEREKITKDELYKPNFWFKNSSNEILRETQKSQLHPSCFVYYEREAYQSLFANKILRITFDSNISSFKINENIKQKKNVFPIYSSKNIIMEIKYEYLDFPDFLKNLLGYFSLKREYFSKYTVAVDSQLNSF